MKAHNSFRSWYLLLHRVNIFEIGVNRILYIIPVIGRGRGPYGKLWTEIFPSFYGPNAKQLVRRAMKARKGKKIRTHNLQYNDRANEVYKMFIIWLLLTITGKEQNHPTF